VKQNFLAGLALSSLEAINAATRQWLDQVANVRVHGETHQVPQELFPPGTHATAPADRAPV